MILLVAEAGKRGAKEQVQVAASTLSQRRERLEPAEHPPARGVVAPLVVEAGYCRTDRHPGCIRELVMHVEIEGLRKGYWLQPVLSGIDLALEPGQIMAILGINGAGKSTLLRCLATLLALDGGEVRLDGQRLARTQLDLRRRLHFVPDSPGRMQNVDVISQIAFILRAYRHEPSGIEETVAELLFEFGMEGTEYQTLNTLSRGQAYKAALIALIALDRDLWLVDEPFGSGMDPRGLAAFRRHARRAASRGRIIVYTTQLLEMVSPLANQVGLLSDGQLLVAPSLEALRERDDASWRGILDQFQEPPSEDS